MIGTVRSQRNEHFSIQNYLEEMKSYEKRSDDKHFINISVKNHIGSLELNRPKALNALSPYMMYTLRHQLNLWKNDTKIHAVVLLSSNDRSFCAGGDIKALYESWSHNKHSLLEFLFREEYQLDALIASYPKPYLSFIDGIVMGGGMGITQNGSYRLMGNNTIAAMPETKIGFFPDAGATAFLQKCPGNIGLYLGMTGNICDINDSLYAGFATHYMSRHNQDLALAEILKLRTDNPVNRSHEIDQIIENFTQQTALLKGHSSLEKKQKPIDHFFCAETFKDLINKLKAAKNDLDDPHYLFAKETLDIFQKRSPFSLLITFYQLQKGRHPKDINEVMALEFSLSQTFLKTPDFFEGIRSIIIDKDNTPNWQHKKIEDVFDLDFESYFKPFTPGLFPL